MYKVCSSAWWISSIPDHWAGFSIRTSGQQTLLATLHELCRLLWLLIRIYIKCNEWHARFFLQKLYFIQPSLCSLVSVSTIVVINWETHFRGPNFKNLSGGAHSCTTPPQQSCLWVELYLCCLVLKFCLPIQFLLKTLTEVMVYQRNWCINTQSGFICS